MSATDHKDLAHYGRVIKRRVTKQLLRVYRPLQQQFLSPPTPEKWVFVTGCYNSGTTLLHKLLSTVPEIGTMPDEGIFFTKQLPRAGLMGYSRLWALRPDLFAMDEQQDHGADPEKVKTEWASWYNDRHAPILVEKSPPTAGRMRWFQRHFPNAHFICLVRNGYAVAEGIRRKAGHALPLTARQWNDSNEIMLRDLPLMKNALLISYEDLTADPVATLRDIYRFIGLEMDEKGIDVTKAIRVHEQESTIQNMNFRSFERLTEAELRIIEAEAEPMLRHFGYLKERP